MPVSDLDDAAGPYRRRMVDDLVAAGYARSGEVEQALRTVPRHRCVPEVGLAQAYADDPVVTRRGADGSASSSASAPSMVALMLDQLEVRPGHRVLEIGTGTGYNAALLAALVGESGEVTTVDIDPEVVAEARRHLAALHHDRVVTWVRDGGLGAPERAPYDRIIVTAAASDLPAAWLTQLAPAGRLVVPLRWRGQTQCVAFHREGEQLRSDSIRPCGFIPMVGQPGERELSLQPGARVKLSGDDDQVLDESQLTQVLQTRRTQVWSGVLVTGTQALDGVWLRLAAAEPGTCRISSTADGETDGLVDLALPSRNPAIAEGGSLAYLTYRVVQQEVELGAVGHGDRGAELAQRLVDQVRIWDGSRTARPVVTAHFGPMTEPVAPGVTVTKPNCRLTVSF